MRNNDRVLANITRIVAGSLGALAAILFIRQLPDLIRYVKIERM